MNEFDQLWIWDNPAIARSLGWYRAVAANRQPAKFRIARTIPVDLSLAECSEHELWDEFDRVTPVFLACLRGIRDGSDTLGPHAPGASLLDLSRELTQRMLTHCNFCRWDCQVDRSGASRFGACKLAAGTRVSAYFRHPGEELVYRGTRGSGTIFFTSCNMRCAFCQNGDISTDKDNGMAVDARELAIMAWLLRMEGCHNINWVGGDPAIHLHTIVEAIALLGNDFAQPSPDELAGLAQVKADYAGRATLHPQLATYQGAFNAPMLWNSNLYLSDETIKVLRLLMDVWLPDFKFGPGRCAISLARTPRYWETVTRYLKLIHDWGEDLTIRHLVMPNHIECCTYPVLDWIAAIMPDAQVNIMNQYRPDNLCDPESSKYQERYAAIARCPKSSEVRAAHDHARRLGLHFEATTFEKDRVRLFV